MTTNIRYCTACGKSENEVEQFLQIGDPAINLCGECIQLCHDVITNPASAAPSVDDITPAISVPVPGDILRHLNQYVIGQERAKRVLAVAVHNHYKRLNAKDGGSISGVEIAKSNVLLIGPTGCGKTLLAQTIARQLDVPFAIADATTLTEAGYVGEDVEHIIAKLLQAANGDPKKAERGIIFIDEIDKIGRKSENPSLTRDVSGEGVQQALLKLIEGTVANVPPIGQRKTPGKEYIPIDTADILFICGGAFGGLEKIIQQRSAKSGIGFGAIVRNKEGDGAKIGEIIRDAQPDDLVKFGLIPELIGRLPIICSLTELDEDSLVRILTEPKNALTKQYTELLAMSGASLTFEDEALHVFARKAIERKTGARGLRGELEEVLLEPMFLVPENPAIKQVVVTGNAAMGSEFPAMRASDGTTIN